MDLEAEVKQQLLGETDPLKRMEALDQLLK
jgi:hypothetical protein